MIRWLRAAAAFKTACRRPRRGKGWAASGGALSERTCICGGHPRQAGFFQPARLPNKTDPGPWISTKSKYTPAAPSRRGIESRTSAVRPEQNFADSPQAPTPLDAGNGAHQRIFFWLRSTRRVCTRALTHAAFPRAGAGMRSRSKMCGCRGTESQSGSASQSAKRTGSRSRSGTSRLARLSSPMNRSRASFSMSLSRGAAVTPSMRHSGANVKAHHPHPPTFDPPNPDPNPQTTTPYPKRPICEVASLQEACLVALRPWAYDLI